MLDKGFISSQILAGGNVLTDQNKLWATNILASALVKVTDPQGGAEFAFVAANSRGSLVIKGQWQKSYPINSSYEITTPVVVAYAEERSVAHNASVVADADILAAPLAPLEISYPVLFRVLVAFNALGIFRATMSRPTAPVQVVDFNAGLNLTANALYMFDLLVHSGDTINLRFSQNATLMVLRVQEIKVGVQ